MKKYGIAFLLFMLLLAPPKLAANQISEKRYSKTIQLNGKVLEVKRWEGNENLAEVHAQMSFTNLSASKLILNK